MSSRRLVMTAPGDERVAEMARRHGFSVDALLSMLESIIRGGGTMAQFSHAEFAGSGQWMLGGMTMVSDMFNDDLKRRIAALCADLAALLGDESLVSSSTDTTGEWWPAGLGWPNSSGAQNGMRYAYFQRPRRLAIEANGNVTVLDTLDHCITGVAQQQAMGSALAFTSQHGPVKVSSLPIVMPAPDAVSAPRPEQPSAAGAEGGRGEPDNILTTLEKLAGLKSKGVLSDEEFAAKKADLLRRL